MQGERRFENKGDGTDNLRRMLGVKNNDRRKNEVVGEGRKNKNVDE